MSETNDPHLRDDVLAAYLDGALPAAERRVADDHFAECATCRDELVAMSKLVAGRGPVRQWPRFAAAVGAVAAAAIAFAVIGPWRTATGPSTTAGDRMRESTQVDGAGRRAVAVVTPAEGETVTPPAVRFVWHPFAPNATYLLKIADDTSSWKFDTADTTFELPDSVRLERGRSYHWWVDALTADGRVASTGVRQFRTSQ
ncbi:MAG TPA: zf-HC2 domain-containing protein [Gemmatimonadaceae bacterium]|nr:zf-HC2 domain-containing protein [Gemmatimonadaceae bacterium]